MVNLYKKHITQLFEKFLYYRHIGYIINKIIQREVDSKASPESICNILSALVISDWTEPTDNGWAINNYTRNIIETNKGNYKEVIEKMLSMHLCLLYAQSFESFERFLKNCIFDRVNRDENIRVYYINCLSKSNKDKIITRLNMFGGDKLFDVFKKAGGKSFISFSSNNNLNIQFKQLWTILSDVRHSITHQESLIEFVNINKSPHHVRIFNHLFNSTDVSDDFKFIELNYKNFEFLMKFFSEFAFQIFKILSIEENFEWKIR